MELLRDVRETRHPLSLASSPIIANATHPSPAAQWHQDSRLLHLLHGNDYAAVLSTARVTTPRNGGSLGLEAELTPCIGPSELRASMQPAAATLPPSNLSLRMMACRVFRRQMLHRLGSGAPDPALDPTMAGSRPRRQMRPLHQPHRLPSPKTTMVGLQRRGLSRALL